MKMIIIHQTEVEQLTVTGDPGDVSEQCSNTWKPLEPIQVMVTLMMVMFCPFFPKKKIFFGGLVLAVFLLFFIPLVGWLTTLIPPPFFNNKMIGPFL